MRPKFAKVVEVVQGKGVKIKIDGPQGQEVDTYYNSLAQVNVGDKVYIEYVSGSVLIVGKLQY